MVKNSFAICVIGLAFAATSLVQAQTNQNVFAVPGANSTQTNVAAFAANPFSSITGFTAGPGTFQVVAKPDGSKFYAIANSGSSTITVVSNSFTNPANVANLGTNATAAAMSEDGKRLAVAAGLLHIIDTSNDRDIVPNGISIGPGVTAFDVAASFDGKTFYVLGFNTAGGSVLAAVDASSTVVTNSLPITGPTTAVAVGPNGLVYVSAPNQILEINPNTWAATIGGAILLNGKPGKLVFTPDGLYALAVNQTPITGSAVLLIGLSSHAVVNSVPNFSVTMDRLLVLSSTQALAYASQNQSLYQLTISTGGTISISAFSVPGLGAGNVTAAVTSNEVAGGGRSIVQSLYVAVNGVLYREDLSSISVTGQFPVASAIGGLSFAGAAVTGTPTTLLQYGNNQVVAPNGVSLPVVVRVLDNNGNPLSGVTVTFGTNNSAASVSPTSATTGSSGFAQTYVTAPAASGPLTVSATAGSQTAAYTMTVGSGGGGPATAGIAIIAGQGQILYENFSTTNAGSPLTVQVNDPSGKPVVNAPVTFAVTQGPGNVNALGSQPGTVPNSIVVTTDNSGQATANFTASSIGLTGTGYASTTIAVSAPGAGSVNFYMTTTPQASAAQIHLAKPNQGDTISGQAGQTLAGAVVVTVTSITGLPIPNVGIRIVGGAGTGFPNATCNDPTGTGVLTDATGTATCDLVLNGVVGKGNFQVNVGYFQNTPNFTIQITSGPPGVVKIVQGNSQSGTPGQQLPIALKVQVTDSFGNILPNVPVTWSVLTAGGVTLTNVFNTTDVNGNASALATLGNVAGNAQVKVTAGSVSATFTLTVNIPSAGIQKISGDSQTTLINTAFPAPVVVEVVDAKGNPVNGVQVTFTVTSGSASVVTPSATTGANGQASTTVNAGSTSGPIVVTAASSTFSVNFLLASRLPGPTNVTFTNGATFQQGISPGSIAIISGAGIAPGVVGLVTASNILGAPQPTLSGISITFNGVTAPIYYVLTATGQPDQVAVQVPFETQPGTASVVINARGGGSATIQTQVSAYAPGLFETNSGGQRYAVALRPDGSYISPSNPAHPGEVIRIYLIGLGQVAPATATGSAGVPGQSVLASLVVGLNNGGVPFLAAEYAPGMVGVYVITLQIPTDTQTGPAQPISVVAFDASNNPYFAQGSFIAIQ